MDILNAEFTRLLASSGWKQAEAARHLELSPAVITRYVTNDTRPSLTVLKLFKLLIGDMQPLPGEETPVTNGEAERPLDAAERQLIQHLRALDEGERRRVVQAFCAMLQAVERKPVVKAPTQGKRKTGEASGR
jgi:transcriptional regulator with XRE-family HTH domain